MSGQARGAGLDQGWAFPASRAGDGLGHRRADGFDIVAVDRQPGHPIATGAVGNRGRQVGRGCLGDGPAVVLADVDNRQLPASRQVEAFVKIAAVGGAVAKAADADAIGALVLKGQRRAGCHPEACS